MQYLLTLYADEAGWDNLTPEQQQQGVAALRRLYGGTLGRGSTQGPQSPAAQHHRHDAADNKWQPGKTQVLDGSFIESEEQLGGYFLIDILDAALAWAGCCPWRGPWRR